MPAGKTKRSDSKPRVAYLVPYLRGFRGWVTFVDGAVRALSRYVEPVLIVSHGDRAAAAKKFPECEHHVLPTVQAEEWSGTTLSMLRWMLPAVLAAGLLPRLDVRLVHSMEMFPAGWAGDALARAQGVPHVLTAHGTYAVLWSQWPLLDRIYRGALRRAAAVYPVSHGTESKLWAAYGPELQEVTVRTVLNGSRSAQQVAPDAARRVIPGRAPFVFSVGWPQSPSPGD